MKKLNRLIVGQSTKETYILRSTIGGSDSGCVFKCLAHLMNYYDGNNENNSAPTATTYEYNCAEQYKNEWRDYMTEMGGQIGSDGDPDISQKSQLMNFIKDRFDTTSDDWVSASGLKNSTLNSMIDDSKNANIEHGCGSDCGGRALVLIDGGSDKYHSLIIEGKSKTDEDGMTYWDTYDPSDNNNLNYRRVYKKDILYGVGISKKAENK